MASRKTVEIKDLIELVNKRNRESVCSPEVRQGWNSMLEAMLHSTGNYAGFGFLLPKDVPAGQKPGIEAYTPSHETNVYPDETRRFYYRSRKLGTKL